jgi:hypothetical protein
MSDYRVPTNPLPVELRCIDGRRLIGDVFLPSHSSRHSGPMSPQEWANTVAPFFPFRPYEGQARTLLNRNQVLAIAITAESTVDDLLELPDTPVYQVTIEAGGQQFQGRLVVDMPRNQQRVVDFLNGADTFITVQEGDRHVLIQKDHITRVVEWREE